MVPGSTLMYGSSLSIVTLRPRLSRIAAREAAAIPLPREDTTPPVTNTNLVIVLMVPNGTRGKLKLYLNPANTSSYQAANSFKDVVADRAQNHYSECILVSVGQ